MKSIRESSLFKSNLTFRERRSVVGAISNPQLDIFRENFWYPHEEMTKCVEMYNQNSFTQSAVNTMVSFIKGGNIVVKSKNVQTQKLAQSFLDNLDVDTWIEEVIENTIKTGNGYVEIDYEDIDMKKPYKVYPIADSSRIYINCDELGLPRKKTIMVTDPVTKQQKKKEVRDENEYYIQQIDQGIIMKQAKWFDMSYHVGSRFKKFRIYGIPIDKRKIIHFRLNIGDTGIYGRSYLASSLDDYKILKQIERSIAVIAKYKAVPRDIIQYGDKDNAATDDELDDFIAYLESLEKDESAVVNKPIKRDSLAYAGQDINLDYMIQHIKKKLISGLAPEFMMGSGEDVNKASAQITLISYILSIYSKRQLFLKPVMKHILKPYLIANKLEQDTWLEFGELDFETQSEKVNRVGAMWVQNLLTFNEARHMLGHPTIGKKGDIYYIEWQSAMAGSGIDMNFPTYDAPAEEETTLPNGQEIDKIFDHQPAHNKKSPAQGGKLPNDPYTDPVNVPKLIPKKDLKRPGSEQMAKFFENTIPPDGIVKRKLPKNTMPENYDLESEADYLMEQINKQVMS